VTGVRSRAEFSVLALPVLALPVLAARSGARAARTIRDVVVSWAG
jgi:hypothetical protein